jgi:hypothetical protein
MTSSQTWRRAGAIVAVLTIGCGTALGQELLLHLPLDGSLVNLGSIGAEPRMYVDEGEAQPELVPGHSGQAIEFDSKATIAVPFDLDHSDYPVVTITAWVKQALATSDTRAILSSGSDAGASLGVHGGRLAAKVGRTGVSFDQDLPSGEWVFVAAVIDVAGGQVRLHQNDAVMIREGLDARAKPPREFRNPLDADAAKQPYLFVGAAQFRNWQQTARRLAIDEVRLYAGALTVEQIDAIRNGS